MAFDHDEALAEGGGLEHLDRLARARELAEEGAHALADQVMVVDHEDPHDGSPALSRVAPRLRTAAPSSERRRAGLSGLCSTG